MKWGGYSEWNNSPNKFYCEKKKKYYYNLWKSIVSQAHYRLKILQLYFGRVIPKIDSFHQINNTIQTLLIRAFNQMDSIR